MIYLENIEKIKFTAQDEIGCLGIPKDLDLEVYINVTDFGLVSFSIYQNKYYLVDCNFPEHNFDTTWYNEFMRSRDKIKNFIESTFVYFRNLPAEKRNLTKFDKIYNKYFNFKKYENLSNINLLIDYIKNNMDEMEIIFKPDELEISKEYYHSINKRWLQVCYDYTNFNEFLKARNIKIKDWNLAHKKYNN